MTEPERQPIDKYIPWFFVAFFAVLSGLIGGFVWLAVTTSTGVVSDHAYEIGKHYNSVIEKQAAQDALGWTSEITIQKTAGMRAKITFILHDKNGKPVKDAEVQAVLMRPTQSGYDVKAVLKMDKPGLYGSEVDLPFLGLWQITIAAQRGADNYQAGKRVTLD